MPRRRQNQYWEWSKQAPGHYNSTHHLMNANLYHTHCKSSTHGPTERVWVGSDGHLNEEEAERGRRDSSERERERGDPNPGVPTFREVSSWSASFVWGEGRRREEGGGCPPGEHGAKRQGEWHTSLPSSPLTLPPETAGIRGIAGAQEQTDPSSRVPECRALLEGRALLVHLRISQSGGDEH